MAVFVSRCLSEHWRRGAPAKKTKKDKAKKKSAALLEQASAQMEALHAALVKKREQKGKFVGSPLCCCG